MIFMEKKLNVHCIVAVAFVILAIVDPGFSRSSAAEMTGKDLTIFDAMWDEGLEGLRRSMSAIKSKNAKIAEHNEKMRKDIYRLQKRLAGLKGEETPPEPQREDINIPASASEREGLDRAIGKLREEKVFLEDEMLILLSRQAELENRGKGLNEQSRDMRSAISQIHKGRHEWASRKNRELNQWRDYEKMIFRLSEEQNRLTNDLNKLEADSRLLTRHIEDIGARENSATGQLIDQLSSVRKAIESLKKNIGAMRKRLDGLKLQKADLEKKREVMKEKEENAFHEKIEILQEENSALRQEITALMELMARLKKERERIQEILSQEQGE